MRRAIVTIAAVFLVLGAVVGFTHARTITVDDDGPADFNNIQAAIDDANNGDTVVVADSTYTGDGNRDIDFHGKAITVKSEKGAENCIIDCNATEHYWNRHRGFSFRSGEGAGSVLDGFTITNGLAPMELELYPPWGSYYVGGGIYCRMSSPTIMNCIIRDNGGGYGGGLASEYPRSSPMIVNCTFSRNEHSGIFSCYGGSFPKITGCTFSGNESGVICWARSRVLLANCILWSNGPDEIVLWGESSATVSYCDIKGGWPGTGNIDANPCFADPNDGDYYLKSQAGRWDANEGRWVMDDVTSPCIDAGDPMSPIGPEPFPNGGIINMGAYGGTAEASKSYFNKPPCETIVAGDVNGDCKVNFLDFRVMALHWLEER